MYMDNGLSTSSSAPDTKSFFDAVLPRRGLRCLMVATDKGPRHAFVDDNAKLAALAKRTDDAGGHVYFACASYKSKSGGRKQANVEAARSLWLDIDCGDGKPYPTQSAGAAAVRGFMCAVGLPKPYAVSSGNGLHAYWTFTDDVDEPTWKAIATLLKRACKKFGLHADPSRTADSASVLRPVGTHHRKGEPKEVKLLLTGVETPPAKIKQLLEAYCGETTEVDLPARAGTVDNSDLTGGMEYAPSSAHRIAEKCGVIALMRDTRGNVDQPTWYHSLGVLAFTEEGDDICHEWSAGHPDYSMDETDAKIAQVRRYKPTSCEKLSDYQPSICAQCPFNGKIKSPISLGVRSEESREVAQVSGDPDGGTAPLPLGAKLLPVPALDARLLPQPLQGLVFDYAQGVPLAPEYVATAIFAACGSILSGKVALSLKKQGYWCETPNAWAVNVGVVAACKTPALAPIREALAKIDARYEFDYQLKLATYRTEQLQYEASVKALTKLIAQGSGMSPAPLPSEPCPPILRRAYTSNSTPEALGVLCQGGPTLVIDDELSGWLSLMADAKNQSGRAFNLGAWNGAGGYKFDRIGRGTTNIPHLCVSMVGNIQPGLLHRFLGKSARDGAHADGLMQRFGMMVYPDLVPHSGLVDRRSDLSAWQTGIDAIAALPDYDVSAHGAVQAPLSSGRPVFTLDDGAHDAFCEWYAWHLTESRNDDLVEAYRQHVLKLPKVVATVALAIHVLEGFSGPVCETVMRRATDATRFFAAHAQRVYSLATQNADIESARMIAKRISTGELRGEITSRECRRRGWSGCETAEDADRVLTVLEDAGWLQLTPQRATHVGGRPTKRWITNPRGTGSQY